MILNLINRIKSLSNLIKNRSEIINNYIKFKDNYQFYYYQEPNGEEIFVTNQPPSKYNIPENIYNLYILGIGGGASAGGGGLTSLIKLSRISNISKFKVYPADKPNYYPNYQYDGNPTIIEIYFKNSDFLKLTIEGGYSKQTTDGRGGKYLFLDYNENFSNYDVLLEILLNQYSSEGTPVGNPNTTSAKFLDFEVSALRNLELGQNINYTGCTGGHCIFGLGGRGSYISWNPEYGYRSYKSENGIGYGSGGGYPFDVEGTYPNLTYYGLGTPGLVIFFYFF